MESIAMMSDSWVSPDQELLSLLAQTMLKLGLGGYRDSHDLLMGIAALIRRNMKPGSAVMDAALLHLMQVELDNASSSEHRMAMGLRFGDRTLHIAGGWFLGYLWRMNDLRYVRELAQIKAHNAYVAALEASRHSRSVLASSVRLSVPPLTINLGPAVAVLEALRPREQAIRHAYETWSGFGNLEES